MRNEWGRECLEAYHKIIPKSEPIEDWEKRIELYALYVICFFSFPFGPSPLIPNLQPPRTKTQLWSKKKRAKHLHRREQLHDSVLFPNIPYFREWYVIFPFLILQRRQGVAPARGAGGGVVKQYSNANKPDAAVSPR